MNTKFLQLTKQNQHEVEDFIEVLFNWRSYGLCIPSHPDNLQIEYGDQILKFEDGTYSSMTPAEFESYQNFLDR